MVAEDVLGLVNTLFRLHSFHLQTTTRYFDEALQPRDLDADVSKAFDVDDPIVLSDVNSEDFENLLWFFYDSAYIWSGVVDPSVTKKWESVLLLAEKFDMKKVAKVACHALGRAGVLQDVPRIALCVKYDMGKDWMLEGLKRLLLREEPLSVEEAVLLGPEVTAKLAAAREQVYRGHIDTTSCTVQSAVCQRCPRLTTCAGGLHICTDYGVKRLNTYHCAPKCREYCSRGQYKTTLYLILFLQSRKRKFPSLNMTSTPPDRVNFSSRSRRTSSVRIPTISREHRLCFSICSTCHRTSLSPKEEAPSMIQSRSMSRKATSTICCGSSTTRHITGRTKQTPA